jgi:hypothetical protein
MQDGSGCVGQEDGFCGERGDEGRGDYFEGVRAVGGADSLDDGTGSHHTTLSRGILSLGHLTSNRPIPARIAQRHSSIRGGAGTQLDLQAVSGG